MKKLNGTILYQSHQWHDQVIQYDIDSEPSFAQVYLVLSAITYGVIFGLVALLSLL